MRTPNHWVILKIADDDGTFYYKLFCTWSGGYLDGDSWRMNSGITKTTETETHVDVFGETGSQYHCNKSSYGLSSYGNSMLAQMLASDKVQLIDNYEEFKKEFENE